MARPRRQIASDNPPVAKFARDLSDLRSSAGRTLKEVCAEAHYSISALSEATNGKRLPTWELTKKYVAACGGDVAEWRRRWNAVAKTQPEDTGIREPVAPLVTADEPQSTPSHGLLHDKAVATLRGLLLAFLPILAMAAVFVASERTDAAPTDYPHPAFATVLAGRPSTTSAARWYTSGVFLGAVSTLTGGLGVLAASRALRTSRLLTYRLVGSRPLAPDSDDDAELFTRHVPRHAATTTVEPSIVRITVANRSRRDIPSRAFDQQQPLRLDLAAPVLEIYDVMSTPGFRVPRLEADGTAIALGPGLIKTRQTITFSAVVARREPRLTVPEPPIIDTRVRRLGESRLARVPAHVSVVASTILLAGVGLAAAVLPRR